MPTPSGTRAAYHQAADVIELVAESKARQFKRIAWLDEEDIKQEVRIKCFATLAKYNPRRADLQTFLSRCAENRLRDIRRGLLYKHNKPCFRCPLWDAVAYRRGEHDCTAFADKMDCEKYARHEHYVHAKMSASRPVSLDENRLQDDDQMREVERSELLDFIYSRLPAEHRSSFDIFERSGFNLKSLKPHQRISLVEVVVRIVEQYQEESYDD